MKMFGLKKNFNRYRDTFEIFFCKRLNIRVAFIQEKW